MYGMLKYKATIYLKIMPIIIYKYVIKILICFRSSGGLGFVAWGGDENFKGVPNLVNYCYSSPQTESTI